MVNVDCPELQIVAQLTGEEQSSQVLLNARRPSRTAEQLGSGELVEDLLCRLGLAVQLEQRGQLMGATPGVVNRTLTMQG